MPWKECSAMGERLKFVARLLDGEKMTVMCREFGISRKICIVRRKINLSTVFAGQYVGVREVADRVWLVSFMDYDSGFFDQDENRVEPMGVNPFVPKL